MINRKLQFVVCLLAGLFLVGPVVDASEEKPAGEQKVHLLRQILLADSLEAAQTLKFMPDAGFLVVPPALAMVDRAELYRRLRAGENRPIEDRLLAAIATVVENYMKASGFAVATAIIPPQNIAEGAVRVAILPGRIRQIKFEGNRWFSESLLREKLRIERGGVVQISELDRALAWTNNNQFRRIKLHVEPVPETGEADLTFGVQERFPIRLTAGYENTGNEFLGFDRYTASLTYGNLWGLDHQASYQQAISHSTRLFRAHAFEYRAPLRWRHVLSLSGSVARVNPTFFSGLFTQIGESITSEAKYAVPFRRQRWEGEFTGTLSFKQSNNNLEFGGAPALGSTNDLLSAGFSAAGVRADNRGRWVVSGTLTASPGRLNSRNDDDSFNEVRPGARPRYMFAQLWLQRITGLTPTLTSVARLSTQLASTNLVPSEQFSAGGANTVRGYEERIIGGDGGYIATHELQKTLPPLSLGQRLPKLDSAATLFWDYGRTITKHPLIGDPKSAYLASVGLGLRFSLGNYFSATADLARQLEAVETPGVPHHRLHVKLTLAY